jgi:hypothetical protein
MTARKSAIAMSIGSAKRGSVTIPTLLLILEMKPS